MDLDRLNRVKGRQANRVYHAKNTEQEFSGWAAEHDEFLARLYAWDADSDYFSSDFLADLMIEVRAGRTLSPRQMEVASQRLDSFERRYATLTTDPEACPPRFDPDVWELACLFWSTSTDLGFSPDARPILYSELHAAIERFGVRETTDLDGRPLNWIPLVKLMILDFWDDEVWLPDVAYAISQFCDVEMFEGLKMKILREQKARDAERAEAARPKAEPTGSQPTEVGRQRRAARAAAEARAEAEMEAIRAASWRPRRSWDETKAAVRRINAGRKRLK